jgi:hypothetical protein
MRYARGVLFNENYNHCHRSTPRRAFQSSAGVNNTPRLFYIPLSLSLTLARLLSTAFLAMRVLLTWIRTPIHIICWEANNIGLVPIKTDRKPTALWMRENSCIENDWEAQRVKSVKSCAAASFLKPVSTGDLMLMSIETLFYLSLAVQAFKIESEAPKYPYYGCVIPKRLTCDI